MKLFAKAEYDGSDRIHISGIHIPADKVILEVGCGDVFPTELLPITGEFTFAFHQDADGYAWFDREPYDCNSPHVQNDDVDTCLDLDWYYLMALMEEKVDADVIATIICHALRYIRPRDALTNIAEYFGNRAYEARCFGCDTYQPTCCYDRRNRWRCQECRDETV